MLPLLAAAIPAIASIAGPMLSGLFGGGDKGGSQQTEKAPPSEKGGGVSASEVAALIGAKANEPAQLPPKQALALERLSTEQDQKQAQRQIRRDTEQAARETIDRIKTDLLPQLREIKQQNELRATQIQATAEHRDRMATDTFRQKTQDDLQRILLRMRRIERALARHRSAVERNPHRDFDPMVF